MFSRRFWVNGSYVFNQVPYKEKKPVEHKKVKAEILEEVDLQEEDDLQVVENVLSGDEWIVDPSDANKDDMWKSVQVNLIDNVEVKWFEEDDCEDEKLESGDFYAVWI